jgi:hypothetical protein
LLTSGCCYESGPRFRQQRAALLMGMRTAK